MNRWRVYLLNTKTGERQVRTVSSGVSADAKAKVRRQLGNPPWHITQARLERHK